MSKVIVEFINTWPGCDGNTRTVEEVANKYGDKVDLKIYYAGKDFDYVNKYGVIFKGTLIINEEEKIEKLSKSIIEDAIRSAVEGLDR